VFIGAVVILLVIAAWALIRVQRTVTATFPGENGLIAFSGADQPGMWDIWALDPASGVATNLTRTADATESFPAWSPDGSKLLFTRGPNDHLWVMDADGSNQQRVALPLDVEIHGPEWMADGCGISFLADAPSHPASLHLFDLRTSQMQPVVGGLTEPWHSWAPTGDQVAVVRESGSLWVADHSGENLTRLGDYERAREPSWSPDGESIVFSTIQVDGPYAWGIYSIGVTGEDATELLLGAHLSPVWSPDGSTIAFITLVGEQQELRLMNPDGSSVTTLTSFVSGMENLDWQPTPTREVSPPCAIPEPTTAPVDLPPTGGSAAPGVAEPRTATAFILGGLLWMTGAIILLRRFTT
jgi:TolB protein